MIRTVLVLFGFSVVLCGLIIFRPFAGDEDVAGGDRLGTELQSDIEVTRAATNDDPSLLAAAAVEPAPELDAALDAVAPLPVAAPEPVVDVVEAPRRVDVARPDTNTTSLDDMTQNVLAELGFAGVEPVDTTTQQQRQSTANILAGIEAATGQANELQQRNTLETIVVAALRGGQSDEDIDTMVNTAAAAGDVSVPEILVTSEGRVDTHILLANIVTQAQIAAGNIPALPTPTPDDTAGLEVRIVQRAADEIEARFYTVQSGDSLGAISAKFYGQVELYDTIFQANRQILSSPDRIRVGQRLVIPQLDA